MRFAELFTRAVFRLEELYSFGWKKTAFLVITLILSAATSPTAVLRLLWIVLKSPYYALRSIIGYIAPWAVMKDVSKETVLITGAASGIGRLMALKFGRLNTKNIVLLDINEEALRKVKLEVELIADKDLTTVVMEVADLSEEPITTAAMKRVMQKVGPVTILINNAGIVTGKKIMDCTPELMRLTMRVNTEALFWTVRAVLPSMLENNHGHIVTLASAAGIVGVPGLADYCASKHAAVGFNESIRLEMRSLGRDGVKTTVVCPFFINTGMFDGTKSRWPLFAPILQPEYAAEKIVRAIRCDQELLLMPLAMHLTAIFRLLPVPLFDEVCELLGLLEAMDDFRGRRA